MPFDPDQLPTFTTARLTIRPRTLADLDACLAMDRDSLVTKFIHGPWADPIAHQAFVEARIRHVYPAALATGPFSRRRGSSAGFSCRAQNRESVSQALGRVRQVATIRGFRQILSVGAGCLNWARPDLCGGRPVMVVPTANKVSQMDKHLRHQEQAREF